MLGGLLGPFLRPHKTKPSLAILLLMAMRQDRGARLIYRVMFSAKGVQDANLGKVGGPQHMHKYPTQF